MPKPPKPRAAVLIFPGTNAELETVAALNRAGFAAEVVRWNEPQKLATCDACVLAGGFSFEDRGRSGLIASHERILAVVAKLARAGKPVLGICNGAQILVESGLVPLGVRGQSGLTLTHNRRLDAAGHVLGTGFYNAWVHIRAGSETPNAFNQFPTNTIINLPVAHGEGRFLATDGLLLAELVSRGQNAFLYCAAAGAVEPHFPTNPNGSVLSLAGVTNPAGNVLALMPHPERTTAGDPIFTSMRLWLEAGKHPRAQTLPATTPAITSATAPKWDAELFVELQITDNAALSVAATLTAAGLPLTLTKYRWLGLNGTKKLAKLAELVASGDYANPEKETVWLRLDGQMYRFQKGRGFVKTTFQIPELAALAVERDAALDNALTAQLKLQNVRSGVLWTATGQAADFQKALAAHFFHHPASHLIWQL